MRLAERVAYVDKRLAELYPNPPIPLAHKDPFTLLIAVMLSAQCTDERVNQITPALFALADSPQAMSQVPVAQVLHIVRPCGLGPQKAKNIVATSKILHEKFAGEVPTDLTTLESFPGVGHKTASVVVAQAWGTPSFPVDTHIHRLAKRWRLSNGRSVTQTERDLKRHFCKSRWIDLHLQMIYYGREHCTARGGCDGSRCEICRHCSASTGHQS